MSVKNTEIVERLKEIRELMEISVKNIAAEIGITVDEYLRYEDGEEDVPVSLLYDVCKILNISMSELLTGDKPKLSVYSITRRDREISVDRNVHYKYKDLNSDFVGRRIEPLLVTLDPRNNDSTRHTNSHTGHEFHYCLEGSFKITIGTHEAVINEGDSIYFDSQYPHGMIALDDKPVKILVIVI